MDFIRTDDVPGQDPLTPIIDRMLDVITEEEQQHVRVVVVMMSSRGDGAIGAGGYESDEEIISDVEAHQGDESC